MDDFLSKRLIFVSMSILVLGQNKNLKNKDIGRYFVQDFKRRIIYDLIKRYETGLPDEDLPRRGLPKSFNRKT